MAFGSETPRDKKIFKTIMWVAVGLCTATLAGPVSYTHLTLPTKA